MLGRSQKAARETKFTRSSQIIILVSTQLRQLFRPHKDFRIFLISKAIYKSISFQTTRDSLVRFASNCFCGPSESPNARLQHFSSTSAMCFTKRLAAAAESKQKQKTSTDFCYVALAAYSFIFCCKHLVTSKKTTTDKNRVRNQNATYTTGRVVRVNWSV